MPTLANQRIWRGNNAPGLIWQFPEGFDLTGSEMVLTIIVNDQIILDMRSSAGDLSINVNTRRVIWRPTVAQSRMIPLGRVARYELERRIEGGEERTYAYGWIVGVGGDNSDE